MARHRILVVDDCPEDCEHYARCLGRSELVDAEIVVAPTTEDGFAAIARNEFDCIVLDQNLPDAPGTEFLARLGGRRPRPPVIMITGAGSESVAAECVRLGARDYLVKGQFSAHEFVRAIRYALSDHELNRRLEDQREEQERFAHAAAHDLRSPLQKIGGFCTLLRHRDLDAGTVEIVTRIEGHVGRLSRLVEGLLECSRTGRTEAPRTYVPLDEIVATAISDLAATPGFTRAHFEIGPLPAVLGDPVALLQVFQNLVANALKFQEAGRSPLIEIGARRRDEGLEVFVRDNGIGIDPSDHGRIFEPLERLHPQSSYPGTGLGLTQCRKIVQSHRATLALDSRLGDGATFRILFPDDRLAEIPLAA